jgi:uncharacterized protein (TIGR02145 family)
MKACPSGWHLPSNAEWDKLLRYVDGSSGTESLYKSTTAGKYLKAKSGWKDNGNGEDKLGFSALPGGFGDADGSFAIVGSSGLWWSSSEDDSDDAYIRSMRYDGEIVNWDFNNKYNLFSVRCVKD